MADEKMLDEKQVTRFPKDVGPEGVARLGLYITGRQLAFLESCARAWGLRTVSETVRKLIADAMDRRG